MAEALRLEYGHQFNSAFASEISRVDPLPHQRIAVYEHMLPQDRRGAGKDDHDRAGRGRRPAEGPGGGAARAPASSAGGVRPPCGRPGVRRIRLAAKDGTADEVAAVQLAQRDLLAEKTEALAELEAAPSRIAAGVIQFVVHALAVPATSSDEIDQYDERVEQIAVRTAVAWKEERGAVVQDVSKPALARAAGLPDSPRLRPPGQAAERRGSAHRSEGPPGPGPRARNRQRMDPSVPSGRQLLALCSLELCDPRADHDPHPEPVRQAARQRARLDHLHDLPQVPNGRGGANLTGGTTDEWEPSTWT